MNKKIVALLAGSLTASALSAGSASAAPAGSPYNPYGVRMPKPNTAVTVETGKSKASPIKVTETTYKPAKTKKSALRPRYSSTSPGLRNSKVNSDGTVSIVVRFKQDYKIPYFPTSEQKRKAAAARLVKQAQTSKQRLQGLKALKRLGFKPEESFWIVNSVAGRIPSKNLGALSKIAGSQGIEYVQEDNTKYPAPQDASPNNDVARVRRDMESDRYRPFNRYNRIALFDSGVQATHNLLRNRISRNADCVNGGRNCLGRGRRTGDVEPNGHGTSSASIMVGSNALGNRFRGVTNARVDSYIIYNDPNPSLAAPCNTRACGSVTGALRAFQRAVSSSAKVITAEMQYGGGENSSTAIAADNAYDAGMVVIGANGNNGPTAGTVNNPGRAHKALGVGAIYLNNRGNNPAQYNNQSRGPASDGRVKPDIQFFSLSETGRKGGNSNLGTFSGTSGSTPYGGAVANLIASWMGNYGRINPGFTYSFLLLNGQRSGWNAQNNTTGVGLVELPSQGSATSARLVIHNRRRQSIPIRVPRGARRLKAAVWWPESVNQTHNDLDLRIVRPNGTIAASSISINGVWEVAETANPEPGIWRVEVVGYRVGRRGQESFLTVHRR
ncbi:Serine protease AprX [Synechococcus sp. MIT S9508]|nr:Serine protease AprX [Synechococcus sp. MIT S9508]